MADLLRRHRVASRRAPAPTPPSTPASTSSTPRTSTAAAPPRARGARSSRGARATRTSWRPRSGARCPTTRTTAASRRRRSPSRSTRRSSACRPTTSTSTSATASIPTCRSRRRSRRCSRSSTPARRATSASASGRPSRSRPRSTSPAPTLFVSSQPQYSMLWRAPEAEIFPLCEANGISQIVWSPLAQGVLTGKYRPGEAPPADSRAASSDMNFAMDRLLNDAIARGRRSGCGRSPRRPGLTMPQLALAWVLRRDELASAIIGASRPEQVHAERRRRRASSSATTRSRRSTRRSATSRSRAGARAVARRAG